MKSYRIAAIGGDGIGPEVIAAGLDVLRASAERDYASGVRNVEFCNQARGFCTSRGMAAKLTTQFRPSRFAA
jgi:isocitrate/isopropylmalate dehydrogenase